jgi:hypothetical protein
MAVYKQYIFMCSLDIFRVGCRLASMCDNLFSDGSRAVGDTESDSDEATEHTRLMASNVAMDNRSFYSDDDTIPNVNSPAVLVPSYHGVSSS